MRRAAAMMTAETTILDGSFATDAGHHNPAVLGTAPGNTVQVEAFVLYLQPMFDGGAAHAGNAQLYLVPVPGTFVLAGVSVVARLRRVRSR